MIIYENTIKNFKKAVVSKRLIPLLLDACKGKDNKISSLIKAKLKLTVSELWFLIYDDSINEDCGVRIDLFISLDQIRICLVLASEDNDKYYVTCMHLFSYEKVKSSNSDDMIYVDDGFNNGEKLLIHPSYQSLSYQNYISKCVDDGKTVFNSFSYLYDCIMSKETDITDKEKYPYEEQAPIVYATNYKKIHELMESTVTRGNGVKALKELKQRAKHFMDCEVDKLFDDQKYIVNQVSQDLKSNTNAWFFVTGNHGTGLKVVANYCKKEAEKQNKKIDIYYGFEEVNVSSIEEKGVSIIIYSKFKDEEKYASLVEKAKGYNIIMHEYALELNVGKSDDGRGIEFLSRKLQLHESTSDEKWNPYNFDIRVVDSENEFVNDKGYVNVLIKSNISYNPTTNKVEGSSKEKEELFKSLSSGTNGICILCEDQNLQEYMKKEVNDAIVFAKKAIEIIETINNEDSFEKLDMHDLISAKVENYLVESIGEENWNKMDKDSQLSLNSAIVAYRNLKEFNQLADFSGVCLQICKAVEIEMVERYFSEYIVFLKEKYGDQALDKANYDLLKKTKNPNDQKDFADVKTQTIGSLPYIVGLYPGGGVSKQYAWNEFKDYAEKVLLNNPSDSLNTISEHLMYTNEIKDKYRNKSAHKEVMDITEAFECIEYVIGSYRKLGVILDAYRI